MSVCACVSALSVHENCGLIPEVLVSCVRCRKFKAFCHYSSTGHQRLQRETFHSVSDSNVLHTWHFNQKSRQSKLSTKSGVIIRHQCLLSPLTKKGCTHYKNQFNSNSSWSYIGGAKCKADKPSESKLPAYTHILSRDQIHKLHHKTT